jgi:hypothetical protein
MKNFHMKDIVPELMKEFPGISKEMIHEIIKRGCSNITHELVQGKDIDISCKVEKVKVLIYKPDYRKKKKDAGDSAKQVQ